MRHTWIGLGGLGAILLGLVGCKPLPELKPPDQPQVLNVPAENDRRYSEPFNYPATVLANDPVKQSMGVPGVVPARGNGKMPGMGGGPGGSGMPPMNQ